MNLEAIKELEDYKVTLQPAIDLGGDVEELFALPAFQRVIEVAYFKTEVERVSQLLATPTSLKREQILNLHDKLDGIRNFKSFIHTLVLECETNKELLKDTLEAIEAEKNPVEVEVVEDN